MLPIRAASVLTRAVYGLGRSALAATRLQAHHLGMRPKVILHNAVSADGRTTGLAPNFGLFYQLARHWDEDLTLAGSDTILAALRQAPEPPSQAPLDPSRRGRLAVIDSRGRIKDWRRVKMWPFWSAFVSICAGSTPREHRDYLRYQDVEDLTAGEERVDLSLALQEIATRYGAATVRVESGGTLNGALLRQALVDEVSLLLHPVLVGGMSPHTIYRTLDFAANTPIEMKLRDCQMLDGAYAWLRYDVVR
jgi:2,5-diamino-6-(ribosylamino)-4(3H)-pyrimidinone 5'-phosphate reductase